jgi:hypothetical protein
MSFNTGQALLGFVEQVPDFFDRHIEVTVSDNITAAEEIMVVDPGPV